MIEKIYWAWLRLNGVLYVWDQRLARARSGLRQCGSRAAEASTARPLSPILTRAQRLHRPVDTEKFDDACLRTAPSPSRLMKVA